MKELSSLEEIQHEFLRHPLCVLIVYQDGSGPCVTLIKTLDELQMIVAGVRFFTINVDKLREMSEGIMYLTSIGILPVTYPVCLYAVHGHVRQSTVGDNVTAVITMLSKLFETVYDV